MPQGNLVHFGAFRTHIGFYPTPSAIAAFEDELAVYATAKGFVPVQFPLHQPLPLDLITRIVPVSGWRKYSSRWRRGKKAGEGLVGSTG